MAIDRDNVSEIDRDMKVIIEDTYNLCGKDINDYKKIDDAKGWHKMVFHYEIAPHILIGREPDTHCNMPCLVCKGHMPYYWPSSEIQYENSGTCSMKCYKVFAKSPLATHITKKQRFGDNDFRCEMCDVVILFTDIDSIHDKAVYCSDKCRGLDESYITHDNDADAI